MAVGLGGRPPRSRVDLILAMFVPAVVGAWGVSRLCVEQRVFPYGGCVCECVIVCVSCLAPSHSTAWKPHLHTIPIISSSGAGRFVTRGFASFSLFLWGSRPLGCLRRSLSLGVRRHSLSQFSSAASGVAWLGRPELAGSSWGLSCPRKWQLNFPQYFRLRPLCCLFS